MVQAIAGARAFSLRWESWCIAWPSIICCLVFNTMILVGLSPDSEGRAPYHFSIPLTQTVLQILPERGWATCASTLSAECVNTIVFVRHTAFSTHRSSHRACSGRDSAIVASRKISMRWGRLYLDILLRLTANRVLLSSAAFTSEHSGLLTRYKSSACTLTEATTKGASTVATDRVFDLLQALVTPKRRGAYEARNLVPGIWESLVDDTSFCKYVTLWVQDRLADVSRRNPPAAPTTRHPFPLNCITHSARHYEIFERLLHPRTPNHPLTTFHPNDRRRSLYVASTGRELRNVARKSCYHVYTTIVELDARLGGTIILSIVSSTS